MSHLLVRFGLVFIVMTALTLASFWCLEVPTTGIDDANIFFVYAKNLSEGRGFVFNAGGERVEGFSSLLWVLLVAAAYALSSQFELGLIMLSVGLVSVTVVLVLNYIDEVSPRVGSHRVARALTSPTLICLVLLGSSPSFVTWMTVTLMEESLWCLLLTATALTVLRMTNTRQAVLKLSFLICAMLLTRPESMLWCLAAPALAGLSIRFRTGKWPSPNAVLAPWATYGLTLGLLVVLRWFYFGYPLPNTFYAKVSPSFLYNLAQGLDYFLRYLGSAPVVQLSVGCGVLALVLAGYRLRYRLRRSREAAATDGIHLLILPVLCLIGLSPPVLVGGDHFVGFRLFQPIYPLLIVNGLVFFFWVHQNTRIGRYLASLSLVTRSFVAVGIVASVGLTQSVTWFDMQRTFHIRHEFRIAESGRAIGAAMTQLFEPLGTYPTVGSITVGGLQYGYRGPVIDLMGLNNVAMGHSQGNREGMKGHSAFSPDVFFKLSPDLLWAGVWSLRCQSDLQTLYQEKIQPGSWLNRTLKGLPAEDLFKEQYRFSQIALRNNGETFCLKAFVNRTFFQRLVESGSYEIQLAAASSG